MHRPDTTTACCSAVGLTPTCSTATLGCAFSVLVLWLLMSAASMWAGPPPVLIGTDPGPHGTVACAPHACLPQSSGPLPCRPGPRSARPTWALCWPRCCAGIQMLPSASPPPCCPSSRALPSRSARQPGRWDAALGRSHLLLLCTDQVASQPCSNWHPFALLGAACFQPPVFEPPERAHACGGSHDLG